MIIVLYILHVFNNLKCVEFSTLSFIPWLNLLELFACTLMLPATFLKIF